MTKDDGGEVVDARAAFVEEQRHLDTVVFVHGLGGDFRETWGMFPQLLALDTDLPPMDIFLWGYPSSVAKPWVEGIGTVGGQLISELIYRFVDENLLHLVGHSLGGLVILKGLLSEMDKGRAQEPPTTNVACITLFAAPVSGSGLAAVVKHTLGKIPVVRKVVNAQVQGVAGDVDMDELLTEVEERIYAPKTNDGFHREVPVRMVIATRDRVVDAADRQRARARFQKLAPLALPYGHSAVKEPVSRNDRRYKALWCDIQECLADRFHRICVGIRCDEEPVRRAAVREFEVRFEKLFRSRLEDRGVDVQEDVELYRSYLNVIVDDCLARPRRPFFAADRAIRHLINISAVA